MRADYPTHTKLAGARARYRGPALQLLHRWPDDDGDDNILFSSEHNTPAVPVVKSAAALDLRDV